VVLAACSSVRAVLLATQSRVVPGGTRSVTIMVGAGVFVRRTLETTSDSLFGWRRGIEVAVGDGWICLGGGGLHLGAGAVVAGSPGYVGGGLERRVVLIVKH